ncbi:unnamed protein product [Lactuca virosa]|uniref:YEATS domain-containing protein n=1 Tax=Lactuca virosa TaxID=75947 RepID=A0AAU9NHB1_9ASTR|nr:unnamed protein product [Lactuca virosa]
MTGVSLVSDQNDIRSHAGEGSYSTHHQMLEIEDEDSKILVNLQYYGDNSYMWLLSCLHLHTLSLTQPRRLKILKSVSPLPMEPCHSGFEEKPQKCGWGEFEIEISIFFHDDVSDKQLDLFHHLKLYSKVEHGPLSTKKPVIVESYDEIVFPNPREKFLV